jgi:small conductance mechanosensitive channel
VDWLEQPVGKRVLGAVVSIALVLVIAVLAWEVASNAIQRYLMTQDQGGGDLQRRARIRTLLPLLHKTLFVFLSLMVVLISLSEIGVDIAPLLAGAGVIGLAIGFGAQKLVQDVITGVFMLVEDALSVGDVVNVAGTGGVVEDMSIRSIRLRDLSGNVHTIPFSSVGTVTNMTKGFSYYPLDIGVDYREDTDRVMEVCKTILDEMRKEPAFAYGILEPLDVLGVDQFAESAVIIKARIKTRPIKQWTVGREFNRRMKKRFDELGIAIPFPHRTVHIGIEKGDQSPPLRVLVEGSILPVQSAEPERATIAPSGRRRATRPKQPQPQTGSPDPTSE